MFQIFTDSSANLPEAVTAEYGIGVLPFHYVIDEKEYAASGTGAEFDGKAFYDQMRAGVSVRTSMINAAAYEDAFEQALRQETDVLYIGMSSGISGAFHSATLAAEELHNRYPQRKISVLDTRAASLGEGLLVLEAAKMRQEGASMDKIAAVVEAAAVNMCQFFTVDDLAYLRRGGRISGVKALAGSILNIKPILRGNEAGEIVQKGMVRGRKRSIAELAELYRVYSADPTAMAGIAHCDSPAESEELAEQLRRLGQTGEILTVCYEPVTGAHVGPGTVALFFHGKHR